MDNLIKASPTLLGIPIWTARPRPFPFFGITLPLRPPPFFYFMVKYLSLLCFIQGFFDNVSKHGPALGYMQWEVPLLSEWLQVGAYWT